MRLRLRIGSKDRLQIIERDQRVAAVSARSCGCGGKHRYREERCEQRDGAFHDEPPSSSASAEVSEIR